MKPDGDRLSAREQVKARLAALNAEIGTYPGPIAGCDAQFNHMLEERTRLGAELARLDRDAADSAAASKPVVESLPRSRGQRTTALRGE